MVLTLDWSNMIVTVSKTRNWVAHLTYYVLQAQSAKLIGDAIQQNPAFLTLRKIEVWLQAMFTPV